MECSQIISADWMVPLELPPDLILFGVRVWKIELELPENDIRILRNVLSEDELKRADRFKVPIPKRNYIACRAALRLILGQETANAAADLHFSYGPNDKPTLSLESGKREYHFNVSHSKDVGLIALARHRRCGIDVEWAVDRGDLPELAERFFALREREQIGGAPIAERCREFYRIWTRKESVLKASGRGITSGLQEPDVSEGLNLNRPTAIEVEEDGCRWLIFDLAPADGYLGAVAVEGLQMTST